LENNGHRAPKGGHANLGSKRNRSPAACTGKIKLVYLGHAVELYRLWMEMRRRISGWTAPVLLGHVLLTDVGGGGVTATCRPTSMWRKEKRPDGWGYTAQRINMEKHTSEIIRYTSPLPPCQKSKLTSPVKKSSQREVPSAPPSVAACCLLCSNQP